MYAETIFRGIFNFNLHSSGVNSLSCRKRNPVVHDIAFTINGRAASRYGSSSRELGKLGLGMSKLTVSFEDNIRFIHVRRCRAERGKGVFERPAEDLLINAISVLDDDKQVF
ncbi:hypothetical protein TNCV_3335211 [Trichonephila clavipes]|nr:hypothetical protein TNCV_3335211 [Trichonephila clavipes]